MNDSRLAFFLGPLNMGGVPRNRIRLARALRTHDVDVDLVVMRSYPEARELVPSCVGLYDLNTRLRTAAFRLRKYLDQRQPDVLIACTELPNIIASIACSMSRVPRKLVLSTHTSPSIRLASGSIFTRHAIPLLMRHYYPKANMLIAVSQGAADDLARLLRIESDRVTTLYNPTVSDEIFRLMEVCPDHPWLIDKDVPVIVTAGRLEHEKDYATLLYAMKYVLQVVQVRLIILGKGKLLNELQSLAHTLDIGTVVSFVGEQSNPFRYFRHADMFVLSSMYEGLPNVIIEALACGCPVVSTDCPSGPREILGNGRYGHLVPVGDCHALASAMIRSLQEPSEPELFRNRAMKYHVDNIVRSYIELFS